MQNLRHLTAVGASAMAVIALINAIDGNRPAKAQDLPAIAASQPQSNVVNGSTAPSATPAALPPVTPSTADSLPRQEQLSAATPVSSQQPSLTKLVTVGNQQLLVDIGQLEHLPLPTSSKQPEQQDIAQATTERSGNSTPLRTKIPKQQIITQRSTGQSGNSIPTAGTIRPRQLTNAASLMAVPSRPDPSPRPTTSPQLSQAGNSSTPSTTPSTLIRRENLPPPYLNPSSNPLQFPTKPEDVRLIGTQPVTLEQALELARRNNRQLQVAELNVERSQAVLRQAQAALYPTLSFNADLSQTLSPSGDLTLREQRRELRANRNAAAEQLSELQDLPPAFPGSLAAFQQQQALAQAESSLSSAQSSLNNLSNEASRTVTGSLEVAYNVYTGGRRGADIRAAERQLQFNVLEVERLTEQTFLDVTGAYYDLQNADEQVRISRSAVENAQASLRDAQALERAGVGTRFDVLRSQVQLANANQDLTRALSQQRISRRQLAQLLSLTQVVDISAADPVQIAGFWNLPLEESIILAYKNRAELEQQLVNREINQQQRRAALADILPQVSVFASYNVLNNLNDSLGFADGYSVGARIRWTIFDGGAARARAAQEDKDIEIAEVQFAQAKDQVRFQVEQAYFNLQANLENIQTTSTALEQARESLRLARLRFQAGVGTQTDVINAETELTRAEVNRLTAILDYNRALATLQRSVSNLSARAPLSTLTTTPSPGTTPATSPATTPATR